MLEWWVYYSDRIVSHLDCSPFEVPRTDIQVILQTYEHGPGGYTLSHSRDWYYWQFGWWPTDLGGLHAWLMKCPPGELQILRGENCPKFHEIMKRASAHKRRLIGEPLAHEK